MTFKEFTDRLEKALTEEEVKATYAAYFNIQYDTSFYHDLYTPQVFFEFKAEGNLHNVKSLVTVLAQTLYYIRRLKYTEVQKPVPFFICLADKHEAALTEVRLWTNYYSDDGYDWERPASKPDLKLIDQLLKAPEVSQIHVYKITQKNE
ncbi:MAG: hypothetical protein NZ551_12290, partial [Microscillaceae bacterium]|nr:hypothetical protein [Microscillaceae bacterium]MDW8461974.1 hypothetical protein [Cytophagales bacterium]